jgi:DNA-nicking Smr family endonuclease
MSDQRKPRPLSVSASDRALFRQTVSDTTPTPDFDDQATSIPQDTPSQSDSPVLPVSDRSPAKGIISQDGNLYYRAGVQKNMLKNLKRGRVKAQAEIDLHGCTRLEALRYLQSFLDRCRMEQLDCIRVITGKGHRSPNNRSVIRETTLDSLRHEPRVLAYSSAPQSDGGSGAFYVLLSS